jgi:hypothetical protein
VLKSLYTFIFVFIYTYGANAAVYKYGSVQVNCTIEADRRTVGGPVLKLAKKLETSVGIQTFHSPDHIIYNNDGTMTVFPYMQIISSAAGPFNKVVNMLNNPGYPNPYADENFAIENKVYLAPFRWGIGELGGRISTTGTRLKTKNKSHFFKLDFESDLKNIDLMSDVQEILKNLGDINTPDFQKYPPIYSWQHGFSKMVLYSNLNLLESLTELPVKNTFTYGRNYVVLQAHYPTSQFNGLSYHVYFKCLPVN